MADNRCKLWFQLAGLFFSPENKVNSRVKSIKKRHVITTVAMKQEMSWQCHEVSGYYPGEAGNDASIEENERSEFLFGRKK